MCGDKVWRRAEEERAEEEKAEEEPGIQNQKQEPHTKMWGKNVEPNFAQAAAHLPVKK